MNKKCVSCGKIKKSESMSYKANTFLCNDCETKEDGWQEEIYEHLANLHPVQIIDGIIKPSIEQVIEDFEDSIGLLKEGDEKEQIKLTKQLISFWKGIRKRIE